MGFSQGMGALKMGFGVGQSWAEIENAKQDHQRIREAQKLTRVFLNKKRRRIIGEMTASVGASGIEMTGSPLSDINQADYELALDTAIIMENFEMEKESSRAKIKKMKVEAITGLVSGAAGLGKPSGPQMAQPGKYGYGSNVPKGTIDTGSYSLLPAGSRGIK